VKKLFQDWRWYALLIFLAVGAALMGSDIQRGITFSTTEHITNVKLHNLIDQATINTTFVTDLSAAQPTASDVFLFVQPGTPIYRKTTYNTLILGATNLITSQAELDLPVTNDFILVYDFSAGTLAKVPLISLFTNAIWAGIADYTNNPAGGFSYPYTYQGNGGRIEHSNLFAGWWQWELFDTNVAASNPLTNSVLASLHTAPTNADLIRIWDKLNRTNKFTTLEGLITNLPAARPGFTNSDMFMADLTRTNSVNPFGTNPVLSKVTFADFFTNWPQISNWTNTDTLLIWSTATNASPDGSATNFPARIQTRWIFQKFFTNGIPVGGTGLIAQGLHGFSQTPQVVKWYLVCTNSGGDLGYSQNDMVPIEDFETAAQAVVFAGGANANQVFLTEKTSTPQLLNKNSTSATGITVSKWNAVCEAVLYP
jgi:hypothetical protein